MKHILSLFLFFTFLWNQPVHGQEEKIIVKFTGEDIEFDDLKVFEIFGFVPELNEPKIYTCGGVINVGDEESNEQAKKPDKSKKPRPELLRDTILIYNVDSNGILNLNSLDGVYYQYKKHCVVSMDHYNQRNDFRSDTIFIEITEEKYHINKIELEGWDLYRFSNPHAYCKNKKIYQHQYFDDLIKKGFSKYEVIEELTYSDSILEFNEKIKNGNWYHYNDTVTKKVLNPYDIRDSIRHYQLEYPEIAEKFQLEGLIIFKLVLTYDNKISDIELVFGNDPILVTETAKLLSQYNYYKDWECHINSYFEHFFEKIPEDLSTEVYIPFEYKIRGLQQFHEEYTIKKR